MSGTLTEIPIVATIDGFKMINASSHDLIVNHLLKQIASLKEQLKREQDCVDFYAGAYSWKTNSGRAFNLGENGNYLTICGDFTQLREALSHRVGGRRAREVQGMRE
jgi:hypothetical protein